MTATVCTTCFPGWEHVEILTVPAMRPCDRCGRPASECHVFRDSTVPALQPHQQRVVAERIELDDRRAKLWAFMSSETYKSLPMLEQIRLGYQLKVMSQYSDILAERIAAFGSPT